MELTETERLLLRAMHRVQTEGGARKSVVTLIINTFHAH